MIDQLDPLAQDETIAQMAITLREWMADESIIAPLTRLSDEELIRLARAIGVALIFSQKGEGPQEPPRKAVAVYDGEPLYAS